MTIKRQGDDIVVRFAANSNAEKIQSILDYLKYELLTADSTVSERDVESLLGQVKSGRFKKSNLGASSDD